jgi:hypothetical protein
MKEKYTNLRACIKIGADFIKKYRDISQRK